MQDKIKILSSLIFIFRLIVFRRGDRTPTQPEPIKSQELSKIPFQDLSGKIVFRRNLKDFQDNYYFILLDAEKKSLTEINNFDTYVPTNLAFSPDGTEILFSYFIYKGQTNTFLWQIYSLDINSFIARNMSPSVFDDSYGAWSPDGNKIAFWSNRGSYPSIWMIDLNKDSSYSVIDVKDVNHTRPTWYPDGENLIYVDADSNFKPTLFHLALTSGETTPLHSDELTASQVAFKHPMLSPDGKYLAFVKAFLNYTEELWIFDMDKHTATQLTTGHSDWHPVWSPDGNKILFSRTRHLYLINKDGGGLTQVTFRENCTDEFPSWVQ